MLDPDSTTPVLVLVILFVLHAYFAAARESIAWIRKSRRLQLIDEGKLAAQLVDDLAENRTLLLATEQLALKSLGFLFIAFATLVYAAPLSQALSITLFLATLTITVIAALGVLIFAELIPKEIARNNAEAIAFWSIYPFGLLSRLATPLAQIVTRLGRILAGRWDEAEEHNPGTMTEEDLRSYVDFGEEEGVLNEEEKEMIHSIFDLDDTVVREVMVPRIDIVAVEADTSIAQTIRTILEAGHSRVPVYADTIDNIIGILYVKDLLVYWLNETQPSTVRGLEREVYYVPETKPVSDLLRELQAKKVHIAIVVDEYGGTAGLVTIEDILEEIVGEIQDEHDADEFYMQHISDNEYIFSARMDLDDINNVMSIDLPTDESDTLGGLIYNILGRIPEKGDSLSGKSFGAPQLQFTVLNVEGRRIKTVKIVRINKRDDGTEETQLVSDEGTSALMSNMHNTFSESS